MKKAAIAIDDWKLEIFKKHLTAAGYTFEVMKGLTHNTLLLRVDYEWAWKLTPIVQAAADECAQQRRGAEQ